MHFFYGKQRHTSVLLWTLKILRTAQHLGFQCLLAQKAHMWNQAVRIQLVDEIHAVQGT